MMRGNILRRVNDIQQTLGVKVREPLIPVSVGKDVQASEIDCLLLKGENLSTLLGLADGASMDVDFCYIDPPYNTGQEFVYSDRRLVESSTLWGKRHDWLAFMLPRLVAVHALMKPTGVIAISIDDYEYANLKILMDTVFGAECYIATIVVCRSKNGKGSKHNVAVNHEYVLLYGKSSRVSLHGLIEDEGDSYNKHDEHGAYRIDGLFRKKGDASRREDRPNMFFPLYYSSDGRVYTTRISDDLNEALPIDSQRVERRWLWGIEKATQECWKLYASKAGVIYVKNYKTHEKRIKVRSLWDRPEYLTDRATQEIKHLYGEKVFETPKPVGLIRDLVDCCASREGIVLDFFAGTGTTAEAVWELNRRDGLHRKTVLIEQSMPISSEHIAFRRGFRFTSDLTEFRLKAIRNRDPAYSFQSADLS